MNRKLRLTKSAYQIKEEQINFLLEDVTRNLEEYKKAIEIRDKQLADTKKILKNAKTSYHSMVKENKQLKEYIVNIKQIFCHYQQRLEEQNFLREKYFQRPQKKYKKVVYQEETDSEPEAEESQYVPENEPFEQEKEKEQKQLPPKRKTKIFEYLNKDAKKHKR